MPKKSPKGKSLAEVNPELAKQWHPTKNGELTPFDVTSRNGQKVWWKCPKGDDHEWEATSDKRSSGRGCPICAGKKVVKSNSLMTLDPLLSEEWHPTKNDNITPKDITIYSNKKFWWKCDKADDHEWKASVGDRSRGRGCPICAGRKVVKSNSLFMILPEISAQWHPTKNGELTPHDVTSGSRIKVWWKCDKADDHEWESPICERLKYNCPICSNQKLHHSNCLATTHPEIAKQWHPIKNGKLTPKDVISGGKKIFWWKCEKGDDHEWEASILERKRGRGCSVCAGKKIVPSNCLNMTHPDISKEWHPTKNGDLTPQNVTHGSDKQVWWKCEKGDDHIWIDSISHRTLNNRNCAVCSGNQVVLSNCLATILPEKAKKWHPTKNGDLTPYDVTSGSKIKVWWKCDKGDDHEWASVIHSIKNHDCPFCTLTPQSRQELTITFELLKIFNDINPKGFKTRVKGKLWTIDIYIPELNLGVEFDGSYWHKDKRALDKLKTKQLKKEGFDIIRVRETPLKKIFRTDVISKQPFNGKEVANKVLKQIMKMYDLDADKIAKIESYIAKKELQNEKGLDNYIDMILTEKAAKKP